MNKLLLVVFLLLAGPLAAQTSPAAINAELDKLLKNPELAQSTVGIMVQDLDSKEVLIERDADVLLNPASNTKLVTAAAALSILGPEHTIFSRVSYDGPRTGSVLKGDLWLKSDGDPFLHWDNLVSWAIDLREQGITKIEGKVMVDDLSFAPGFIPPAFDQKNEDAAYRAPIGAVSVSYNSVSVYITPAEAGKPANVRMVPPNDYVEIINDVRTQKGKRVSVSGVATEKDGRTLIRVRGVIGESATGPGVVRKRIDNPSLFAASAFMHALKSTGIEVSGEYGVGARPDGTTTLVLYESAPLWQHLASMNKWSNNFMAEMIFRQISGSDKASTEDARAKIDAFLTEVGLKPGWTAFNGSGLYDGNLFSARHINQILVHMDTHAFGPEFKMSLPIAGRDGTLKSRLEGSSTKTRVRGKTGTLNEVTALAGYITTKSGRRLAYTVIFNKTPVRAWTLRDEQDAIVSLFVGL